MRRAALTLAAVIALAPQARAGDGQANELVGLMTQAVRATTEQLQLAQHIEGARLSAEPLGQLDRYLTWMLAEERRVAVGRADPGVLDAFERAVKELRPEWERVSGRDELASLLPRMPATRRVAAGRAGGRAGLAVRGVEAIAAAVQSYELRLGRPPDRLGQLAAPPGGGKPFLTADALTDPWGRPYRYDAAGPNNGGVRPDVWTTGPEPADVIGNWQAGQEKSAR